MRRGVMLALLLLANGCASAPPPKSQQGEVPIRTQEEVARDQSTGGSIVDPAQCATKVPPPGCPKNTAPDAFADTHTGRRLPRMVVGH
jgi:hypothetical protein